MGSRLHPRVPAPAVSRTYLVFEIRVDGVILPVWITLSFPFVSDSASEIYLLAITFKVLPVIS